MNPLTLYMIGSSKTAGSRRWGVASTRQRRCRREHVAPCCTPARLAGSYSELRDASWSFKRGVENTHHLTPDDTPREEVEYE